MMKREDWRNWCAWRALEETDREAERLARPVRVEATAQSAGGLKSDQVVGLKPEVVAFLTRRCARLRERAEPATVKWVEARRVPRLPGMWVMGLLAAAAVVGFVLTQLGQERELNLLALPLVGVLVWNAIVMLVAVVGELWPERKGAEPSERDAGWLVRMVRRRVETEADGEEGLRFWQLTGPTALRLVERQGRVWLHVAAAVLALASAVALFARGWSREYRVVWESTLLTEQGAGHFFQGLFGPASAVFDVPIPLEALPAMRRRAEVAAAAPAPALPWLELYAGTLLLGVVFPRLLLAGVTLWGARRRFQREVRAGDWDTWARSLLRATEGGEGVLPMIFPGTGRPPANGERWLDALRTRHGGLSRFEWICPEPGAEEEWLAGWEPRGPLLVLGFFLVTTPEVEVQGELVRQVRDRVQAGRDPVEIEVLLDAMGAPETWPEERSRERLRLWRETLGGAVTRILLLTRQGLREVSGDRATEGAGRDVSEMNHGR
ncbi:MAG: DUF2868 domain-containing protein [Verrucomicrobiales bacterium]|nr:DUF2868 domain-containing protein [Verrucomicrobiales bacterium]